MSRTCGPRWAPDIDQSLGYYNPPRPGKGNRAPAYFFRDPGGQLPVTATLYHEVSHQLLFETAGPNGYTKNAGNYWVFEGLGTYFETVTPQPDGSLEVGGLVGERIAEARQSLADRASSSRSISSSGSTRTRSTAPSGSTSITSRRWP